MELLTAEQAATALKVSKATLYSYVSRGLLESVAGPEHSKRYRRQDIERLQLRRQRPREAAREALYWGLPSLPSQVSSIDRGELYYRGQLATELAFGRNPQQLAGWLWEAEPPPLPSRPRPWKKPFLQGALEWLAASMEADPAGWDLSPEGVRRTGWRIFCTLRAQLEVRHPLLDPALILLADHELNASTFAARVAASTGANPYAVVCAGLATLSGPRHGGACAVVEALFREACERGVRRALADRLRRGDSLAGFGHRLYPNGDPRARALLERLPEAQPWVDAGQELLGLYPSIDLALVALGLPEGTAFKIFATGRCLGWIAHALEQYSDPRMIRPRAGEP